MTDYPQEVVDLAKECDQNNRSDINAAVDEWYEQVRLMPGSEAWIESFVKSAGRQIIQDCRHTRNTRLKRGTGQYGGPAKTRPTLSTATTYVESLFNYAIDGRRLGDIQWKELTAIADAQREQATGHMFNANLCIAILGKKPKRAKDDSTIESTLKEPVLRKLFSET